MDKGTQETLLIGLIAPMVLLMLFQVGSCTVRENNDRKFVSCHRDLAEYPNLREGIDGSVCDIYKWEKEDK